MFAECLLDPGQLGKQEPAVLLQLLGPDPVSRPESESRGAEPVAGKDFWDQFVVDVLALSPGPDQSGVAQGGKMLRGRRLRDGKPVGDFADSQGTAAEHLEDPVPGLGTEQAEQPGTGPAVSSSTVSSVHLC